MIVIRITKLEKELGFGAGIISRWGNDADPSLSKILQIAEYFKVSIDDIVGYGYIIHDKFIEKLISQTENKIIKWKHYDNSLSENPKQFKDNPVALKKIYNQVVQTKPEFVDMINKLNNSDLQKIQQILSNPGMVELSMQVSKIAELFKDVQ